MCVRYPDSLFFSSPPSNAYIPSSVNVTEHISTIAQNFFAFLRRRHHQLCRHICFNFHVRYALEEWMRLSTCIR